MRFLRIAAMLPAIALSACGAAAVTQPAATSPTGPQLNEWTPRLAIVKPQFAGGDDKNVSTSVAVDVTVWPSNKVVCGQPPRPGVDLYLARNNEPGELIKKANFASTQRGGRTIPALEFNNVQASLAADPNARYKLVAFVRGQPASNVW